MGSFIVENKILKGYMEDGKYQRFPNKKLTIPKGVETIAGGKTDEDIDNNFYCLGNDPIFYSSFMENENIEEVVIPEGVVKVGDKAFEHSKSIQKLYVPKSLKSFGFNSIWGYTIKDVYYNGTIFEFDKIDFDESGQNFVRLHCTDCEVDFTKEYYIDECFTDMTKDEWEKCTSGSWIQSKIKVVHYKDE